MALASFHVDIVSHRTGRSAVAAAAYRSADKLHNAYDGRTSDYTRKKGVIYTEILAPQNAPKWALEREPLWNESQKAQLKKDGTLRDDAQLAREVIISLQRELTKEQNTALAKDIGQIFVGQGMVVDLSIHDKWDGNPHAHYLMTMREITENGFSKKKNGDWDKNDYVLIWRKSYQDITNRYLEMNGFEQRICVDSYEKQGIDKTPTIHLGHYVHCLEQMGIESRRGNINREIHKANQEKDEINKEIALLQNKLEQEREHAESWHDKIEHYRKVSEEVQRTADVLEHRLTQRGYLISSNNKKMLKPFCNAISPPNFRWKTLLKILLPRRKGRRILRSFSSLQGCRRILDITADFLPCGGNLTRSQNRNRWVGLRPHCHTGILRDGHLPNNADFSRSMGNRGTKRGGNIRHRCIAIRMRIPVIVIGHSGRR